MCTLAGEDVQCSSCAVRYYPKELNGVSNGQCEGKANHKYTMVLSIVDHDFSTICVYSILSRYTEYKLILYIR